ncbi:MAG: MBL fold metallo-hydrolase [Planctomycetes bacterium]|nr:MBL fold metallo-hydrolase [Planctomycetota bacterium]
MPVEITWLGHASFRIQGRQAVVYIDPWKLSDSPHDADVVIVSHSHYDHLSPEDVEKVARDGTAILAPSDTAAKIPSARAVAPGERVTAGPVTVEAVPAYNIGKVFHRREKNWIGAVVTVDGKRVYYAGDTDLIPEMSDLADVDLALLPVGGTYTLDAAQAAEACRAIGCKLAVPYHWGDVVGSEADATAFVKAAACPVKMLRPGQSVTI